jgi:hypothetical protein
MGFGPWLPAFLPSGSPDPASLAYLEFVVVLTATYRLYILVSRIR